MQRAEPPRGVRTDNITEVLLRVNWGSIFAYHRAPEFRRASAPAVLAISFVGYRSRGRSFMVAELDRSLRPSCSSSPRMKASDWPWRGSSTRVVIGVVAVPADRNSAAKATVEGAMPVVSPAARVTAEWAELIM